MTHNHPQIGMADWLLTGGSRLDRIAWLVENGFHGISFLQSIMDIDPSERKDMAAAISEADLYVTYHGNVQDHLKESGELDLDFANHMFDDVIWWHENTNGVCVDILSGKYVSDIYDPFQTEALLISKDKIKTTWQTATDSRSGILPDHH